MRLSDRLQGLWAQSWAKTGLGKKPYNTKKYGRVLHQNNIFSAGGPFDCGVLALTEYHFFVPFPCMIPVLKVHSDTE